jgi:hypothetical protein
VGVEFLHVLDSGAHELHRKVIGLRDSDHVHSDFYEGRIHVKIEGANLYVEEVVEVDADETKDFPVKVSWRHSHETTIGSLTREELPRLRDIAIALRNAFRRRAEEMSGPILAARWTAGYRSRFCLRFEKAEEKSA